MNHLLAQARGGDEAAERQLFKDLLVQFKLFAERRIGEHADAEDVVQEACLTVVEKYKTVTFSSDFEAWAYGVLNMKICSHRKRLAVRQKRIISEPITDESKVMPSMLSDPEFKRRLIKCLKKVLRVNRRYARVLNLTYQGYRRDEICEKLKVTGNNLYVLLNRGRSMLRDCLERGEV